MRCIDSQRDHPRRNWLEARLRLRIPMLHEASWIACFTLGDLLDAGYERLFDLELVGPRIDAENARAASTRAAERLSEMLIRLGA
jgi:hypothetical protein